jgi:serine/threonine protein kinase
MQLKDAIKQWSMIDHRHCVRLLDAYESKKKIYIIMERMKGSDLFDRIVEKACFSEIDAVHCMQQFMAGLKYLHASHYTGPRRLCPELLIYDDDDKELNDAILKIDGLDFSCLMKDPMRVSHHDVHGFCGMLTMVPMFYIVLHCSVHSFDSLTVNVPM